MIHCLYGFLVICSLSAGISFGNKKVSGRNLKCLSPKRCNLVLESLTMHLFHSRQVFVHAILSSHFRTLWPVVYFLIPRQILVDLNFYVATCPEQGPFMLAFSGFSEAIVFKRISDQLDTLSIVEFKVVAFFGGLIGTYRHGIDVGPKY